MGADLQATGEILIRNADWVITVDPERRVLSNGSILVRDGIIAWVGKAGEEPAIGDAMEVIDGRGLLALPGLIDTSIPVVQQLGRGAADLCDIADYRLQRLAAYEGALTPADATAAAEA
jgi:5-methylthioadenosine/S-adenosylhomocysteine deaminase